MMKFENKGMADWGFVLCLNFALYTVSHLVVFMLD